MRAHTLNDVEYGKAGRQSLRMDGSVPPASGLHPAAVIVHGGGWVAGHRRHSVEPLFRPLEDAGFAWFSISYRLATDVAVFGLAIDDVAQAVEHVRSHAAEYSIDPARVALIADSAGAHLGMMAVLRAAASTPVSAVATIAMPSNLEALANGSASIPASLREAVASSPWADMLGAVVRGLSPINYVHADMPPTLLIHGTEDRVVPYSQSEEFCAAARAVGAQCELYPVRGEGHGFRWWSDRRWITALIQWLDATLAERPVSARS